MRHKKSLYDRSFLNHLLFLAIFLAVLYFLYIRLASAGMTYEWHWNRVWRHFGRWTDSGFIPGPLLNGLGITVAITLASIPASCVAGLGLAIMRLSPWPLCNKLAIAFVAVWRNTPLLLQLFFIYFLVSPLFSLNPFASALLALAAFEGAYMAEIFRAAVLSISPTQWESSLSLGFGVMQTFRLVILPQAMKNAGPAFINQIVCILKDTSLVSAIALADITLRAQAIVAETFLVFEIWLLVGVIYIALALCLSLPAIWLENRSAWH